MWYGFSIFDIRPPEQPGSKIRSGHRGGRPFRRQPCRCHYVACVGLNSFRVLPTAIPRLTRCICSPLRRPIHRPYLFYLLPLVCVRMRWLTVRSRTFPPTPPIPKRHELEGAISRIEHAGNQEIILGFYNDGLACEGFEDRQGQLLVMLRERVVGGQWELTFVADAEGEKSLEDFSDFGAYGSSRSKPP